MPSALRSPGRPIRTSFMKRTGARFITYISEITMYKSFLSRVFPVRSRLPLSLLHLAACIVDRVCRIIGRRKQTGVAV